MNIIHGDVIFLTFLSDCQLLTAVFLLIMCSEFVAALQLFKKGYKSTNMIKIEYLVT